MPVRNPTGEPGEPGPTEINFLLSLMTNPIYDYARRVDAYRRLETLGTRLNREQRGAFECQARYLKDEIRRAGEIRARALVFWVDANDKIREKLPL